MLLEIADTFEMLEQFEVLEQFELPRLLEQLEYLFRIVLSTILGLLIGHERKNRNKSAGIRTHAIVALGAALIMVVSKYGFTDIPDYDAARVAAQVVSGVGFLGAGVIFVRNNLVSGLTTAAGIWATAGVGLAMGSGLYVIGISSAILIILLQFVMHRIAFFAKVASCGMVRLTIAQKQGAVKEIEDFIRREKIDVAGIKINKSKKDEIKLELDLVYPPGYDKAELLSRLAEQGQVITVSE